MRFMSLYKPGRELHGPPSEKERAELGRLVSELTSAGIMLGTDGLQDSAKGARVVIADGQFTTTDGPFAETKELIAGYAILDVASKAEAIALARRFLAIMGEGECEVRLMHEMNGDSADCG